MFEATYLGHQGWLIESGATRLLADPVLHDGLTGMPGDSIAIYPPRRLDLGAFPPVDGVIISHEHPDHLNLPTLLRLDRSVRIFLPDKVSAAARTLVAEL